MYWTSETASVLGNAPWENGITKDELIEYAERNGASQALLDDLSEIDDNVYFSIYDLCDDIPTTDNDFGWNEDEY